MAKITFYEKPGCGNNTRQKALLIDAGHEVIARNLLTEPWTAKQLLDFFTGLPVVEWFNRAAPRVKSGEIIPESLDENTALALMLADPLLIRRPLMESAGQRLAGFDLPRIQAWLGLPVESDGHVDLQSCPRSHASTPCPTPGEK